MTDLIGVGLFASLRKRVERELRDHSRQNLAMRRSRYSWAQRVLRHIMVGKTFGWFLGAYALIDLAVVAIEVTVGTSYGCILPGWTAGTIKNTLQEITGYLIAGQVGLLAVLSVAVGLVTLISQRDETSATNPDVRLYYSESLAYEVVGSSTALLLVLCVELFWPFQFALHQAGYGGKDLVFKVLLTALHIAWSAVNIILLAHFLTTTLRFVEPKARSRMRERFTANWVIPHDLRRRLLNYFYINAPSTLIAEDNGALPHISFGHGLGLTDGLVEIEEVFVTPVELFDVWMRPLRFILRRWWARSQTAIAAAPKTLFSNRRSVWLSFRPSFEGLLDGQTVLCGREGGSPLTPFERWLAKRCFRFRIADRDRDLPEPANLLEQLQDRVVIQIERLAQTGFRQAFDEATSFHSFLLELHDSRDEGGHPINLSQIGGFFEAPYQRWMRQYRRVMEVAASKIGIDNYFINTMSRTALRLLPPRAENVAAPVIESILDIGAIEVVMLEAWFTRRTTIEVANGATAQPRLMLAGSDQRAYEAVVVEFVGAWESIVQLADTMYGWRSAKKNTPASRWNAFRSARPFLQQHLLNSAYLLASAIWNEDAIGTSRYRDMFVRWTDRIKPDRAHGYHYLKYIGLITPDIIGADWTAAESEATHFKRYDNSPATEPETLFSLAIRNMHSDYLSVTAAVSLHWYMAGDYDTPSFGSSANSILRREFINEEGNRLGVDEPQSNAYLSLWELVFRCATAERKDGGYATYINGLVRRLSGMSERRVVPGRIYSGFGSDGIDSLQLQILVMIAALLPGEGDQGLLAVVKHMAERPEILAGGNDALQNLTFAIQRCGQLLDAALVDGDHIKRGLLAIDAKADATAAFPRLQTLLKSIVSTIEQVQFERLKAMPIDDTKVEALRAKLENVITTGGLSLALFRGFECVESDQPTDVVQSLTFDNIDKGDFVTPSMSVMNTSDLFDHIAASFADVLGGYVRRDFWGRAKTNVNVASESGSPDYWNVVFSHVGDVGAEPALLVPSDPVGNTVARWQYANQDERPGGRTMEYRQGRNSGLGAGYMSTMEGLDIFQSDLPPNESVLLSSTSLRTIVYHPVAQGGPLVTVGFVEEPDIRNSKIVIQFSQKTVWHHNQMLWFVAEGPKVEGTEEAQDDVGSAASGQ